MVAYEYEGRYLIDGLVILKRAHGGISQSTSITFRDRHHNFKSGNTPKTEGGQTYLIFVITL